MYLVYAITYWILGISVDDVFSVEAKWDKGKYRTQDRGWDV